MDVRLKLVLFRIVLIIVLAVYLVGCAMVGVRNIPFVFFAMGSVLFLSDAAFQRLTWEQWRPVMRRYASSEEIADRYMRRYRGFIRFQGGLGLVMLIGAVITFAYGPAPSLSKIDGRGIAGAFTMGMSVVLYGFSGRILRNLPPNYPLKRYMPAAFRISTAVVFILGAIAVFVL